MEARRHRGRERPWDAAASGPRSRAAVGRGGVGRRTRRRGAACAGAAAEDAGGVGAGLRRQGRGGRGAAAGARRPAAWRGARARRGDGNGVRERVRRRSYQVLFTRSLPSVRDLALGKDFLKILKYSLPSARSLALGKESFTILCRVLSSWHSANHPLPSVICGHSTNYFFIFFIFPTKLFVVCSYTM